MSGINNVGEDTKSH